MKYNVIKMEDALDALIDYRGKTPAKSESGIQTLSAKSVKNGYIDYSQCYFISKEEYDRFMVRGFPRTGDILLTTEAPMGFVARLDRDDVAIAQRLLTLRGKKDVLDSDYLMYYLQSPKGQAALKARETGTTVTGIKQAEFRKIELELPDYDYQMKVSGIMRAIDKKIELNNAINENLAELLQSIYQQRFNCSDSNEEHSILADICDYSKEKIAVSSLSVRNYYSTENMLPGKAGAVDASSLPTIAQTTKCTKGDVLISNIRPYFKKIVYCQSDCGCSMDVLCFTPKSPKLSAYLFSTLYADRFFGFMVAGAKGTKMPRGDKQQIMTYSVRVPSDAELDEFNGLATPILAQIESNWCENISLSALREGLLPKLLSGEIDVSNIRF